MCGKQFASQSSYTTHLRIVHEGNYKYKCQLCERGFVTRGDLDGHLNKHRGIKPYACNLCASAFTHKKNLIAHMRRHINKAQEVM